MPGRPVLTRLGVLAAYTAARRRRFADAGELRAWQARRLSRVLERAKATFPFYAGLPATGLDAFPVLTKAIMTEHFAQLNDRGLTLRECLDAAREAEARRDFAASRAGVSIGLSSGTSGQQSVFLTSPAERRRWAGAIVAKALPGGLRAGARVALVLRAGGPLYESVGGGRVAFRFFDLARPPDEHFPGLSELAPTIVAAPPSVLRMLAEARRAGRLRIAPERVFSVAEVLDSGDADAIEAGFGCRADQIYQATEGFLGISCDRGRLHLNEDLLLVERVAVDRASRRFSPVVTDLYRRTQAMIRVRLDDILIESAAQCPCGSPFQVIERIEGRADDVLMLASLAAPGGLRPLFPDFVRAAVLAAPHVEDFHVAQPGPGLLTLGVRPAAAGPQAARALLDLIARSGLRQPRIEPVAFAPPPPPAKLRRVRRDFPLPEGTWPS
jgi:putative adenylate-forming enzyme